MSCVAQRRPKEIVAFISIIIAVLPILNLIRGFYTSSLALDFLIFYAPFLAVLLIFRNHDFAAATPTQPGYPGWSPGADYKTGRTVDRQPDADRWIIPRPAIPALILAVYAFIRSDGSYTGTIVFILVVVYLAATLSGFFDIQQVFKTIIFVSCLASILVIVQTISFYGFDKYLQMVWLDICRYDIIRDFSARLISGRSALSSLFRPAGFFLEPSHFAQYVAIGLADLLFSNRPIKNRYGKVTLISLGLICSTSGMGVMVLIYEFTLYAVLQMKGKPFATNSLRVVAFCFLAAGIFAALMQINTFHLTIQRVFGEVDGYNAVSGRTVAWNRYIKDLPGTNLLFGRGTAAESELNPVFFITGAVYLIYTLGIIGGILFVLLIVMGMVKSNTRSLCLGCYFLVISFFSETYVGVWLIFNAMVIYSGRLREERPVRV